MSDTLAEAAELFQDPILPTPLRFTMHENLDLHGPPSLQQREDDERQLVNLRMMRYKYAGQIQMTEESLPDNSAPTTPMDFTRSQMLNTQGSLHSTRLLELTIA